MKRIIIRTSLKRRTLSLLTRSPVLDLDLIRKKEKLGGIPTLRLEGVKPGSLSRMPPISYEPSSFWGVAFARRGSAIGPRVISRSIGFLIVAGSVCAVQQYLNHEFDGRQAIVPFMTMVAVMTSFRVNAAVGKWEDASRCIQDLHGCSRVIITKLCSYSKKHKTPAVEERLIEIRRLLVLVCVLIKKHVRQVMLEPNRPFKLRRAVRPTLPLPTPIPIYPSPTHPLLPAQ